MFERSDLPATGTMSVYYDGEDRPVLYDVPLARVELFRHDHGQSLHIGDDHGGRVASLPFVDAEQISDRQWRFVGPDEDFTITLEAAK